MAASDHAVRLSDDMVTEILLRLPPADALRSRAVCRAWRRIAESPAFLAAHARRQPLELILEYRKGLDTTPLAGETAGRGQRRLICLRDKGHMEVVGACGALLVFERYYGLDHVVCNPTTRQWLSLPRTPSFSIRLCGLYIHRPSGEHRLLYLAHDDGWSPELRRTASHRVLSLGAAQARRVGPPAAGIEIYSHMPEAYLQYRGKLHWLHHPEVHGTNAILAFDTVSETFRRISRPPVEKSDPDPDYQPPCFLVEAHGNLAVMATVDGGSVDLWVMEDYDSDSSWRRHLRISRLPPPLWSARWAVNASDLGQDVILLGDDNVGERLAYFVLYDLAKKKVVKQVNLEGRLAYFMFRGSLERHAFFNLQDVPSS